ncbi:MAG: hypothetical protein ACI8PZ_005351, partial [Myxococcota bacterium]
NSAATEMILVETEAALSEDLERRLPIR